MYHTSVTSWQRSPPIYNWVLTILLLHDVSGAPRVRKPPAPKGTKKVKKRNPWSDDESKSDSDVENSEPIIPRENKSQRASGEASSSPTCCVVCLFIFTEEVWSHSQQTLRTKTSIRLFTCMYFMLFTVSRLIIILINYSTFSIIQI